MTMVTNDVFTVATKALDALVVAYFKLADTAPAAIVAHELNSLNDHLDKLKHGA